MESTPGEVKKISNMIAKVNHLTQREMTSKFKIFLGSVNNIIHDVLHGRLRKKFKNTPAQHSLDNNWRQKAWKLYQKLSTGKWKNFVKSAEALFYLCGSYGCQNFCCFWNGSTADDRLKFVKHDAFAGVFMAWAGVCYNGKTQIRINDKGTEVNSAFYIEKVLKPFLDVEVPMLFPSNWKRNMVFHQDSASNHAAKTNINYLKSRPVSFVTPDEWMPKSPDAALMDYGIWGILKRKLHKRNINTIGGLKKGLKGEWQRLDQAVINKTFQSWPKQCRMINYCCGSHIEHL